MPTTSERPSYIDKARDLRPRAALATYKTQSHNKITPPISNTQLRPTASCISGAVNKREAHSLYISATHRIAGQRCHHSLN